MKYGSLDCRFSWSREIVKGWFRWGTSGLRSYTDEFCIWMFSISSLNSIFLDFFYSLTFSTIFTCSLSSSKEYTLIVNWLVIEFITNLNAHRNSFSKFLSSLSFAYFDWLKWRLKAAILTSFNRLFSYTIFLSLVLKMTKKQSSTLGSIAPCPETKFMCDRTSSSITIDDF